MSRRKSVSSTNWWFTEKGSALRGCPGRWVEVSGETFKKFWLELSTASMVRYDRTAPVKRRSTRHNRFIISLNYSSWIHYLQIIGQLIQDDCLDLMFPSSTDDNGAAR